MPIDPAASLRWKLASITAPAGNSAASANRTSMAARPVRRDASTSTAGHDTRSASLIVSLASRGSANASANADARVDLPLPGGPETTTNRRSPILNGTIRPRGLVGLDDQHGAVRTVRHRVRHAAEIAAGAAHALAPPPPQAPPPPR